MEPIGSAPSTYSGVTSKRSAKKKGGPAGCEKRGSYTSEERGDFSNVDIAQKTSGPLEKADEERKTRWHAEKGTSVGAGGSWAAPASR